VWVREKKECEVILVHIPRNDRGCRYPPP
jgi:hypothetical protein